jgi:hypothetical protein
MRTRLYQQIGEDEPGDNERAFLGALNEDLQEIDQRLTRALKHRTKVQTVTITTTGTEVRHGIGRVPRSVWVTPKDLVTWCEYRERTPDSVFLKASAAVEAEVRIEG